LHKASSWQAKRYAGLSADQDLADKIFSALEAEWDRTVHALNEITGTQHRLAETPWLARFRHRFPYISPLNHLQVELIRRGDLVRRTNELGAALNGVAADLRNTG
jgi:phosphoenolpyruvate carboxylase